MKDVRDNPEQNRFELNLGDGQLAFALYRRDGDILYVTHTETPPALRGQGIASRLVEGLLGIARQRGEKVAPRCGFVRRFLDEHPEHADLRA